MLVLIVAMLLVWIVCDMARMLVILVGAFLICVMLFACVVNVF